MWSGCVALQAVLVETVRNVGIKNVSTQCHRNRASLLKTLCFARYAAWQLEKTRGPRVFPFYFVKTPCSKGFPEGRQAQWEETRLACSLLCEEEGSRGTQSSDGGGLLVCQVVFTPLIWSGNSGIGDGCSCWSAGTYPSVRPCRLQEALSC